RTSVAGCRSSASMIAAKIAAKNAARFSRFGFVASLRSRGPRAAAILAVAVTALAFPANAFAHAALRQTWPSFRQRVDVAPKQVRLHFDQVVKPLSNSIVAYTARGRVVSLPARSGASRYDVVAPLRRLARGPYTVR